MMIASRFPALNGRGAVAAVALALVAAACGGSGATVAPATTPTAAPTSAASQGTGASQAAAGTTVKIVDFAFDPATLSVKSGTTVMWTNTGTKPHTVTADDNSVDSGTLAAGATFSHAFTTAGTFAYHCMIHTNMKATITVTG